jgi:hypothetical protein
VGLGLNHPAQALNQILHLLEVSAFGARAFPYLLEQFIFGNGAAQVACKVQQKVKPKARETNAAPAHPNTASLCVNEQIANDDSIRIKRGIC